MISKPSANSNWSYSLEILNLGQNWWFFVPCDFKIWQMTLKNNRAHLLSYFKLCASFHRHLSIQNGVTVQKCQIWVKIGDFFSCVTLKFDGWPWKTIGHLFYAPSSFVYHFIAFCEIKLKLQSGKTNLAQNQRFFVPCDLEIWQMTLNKANLTDLIAATSLVILLKIGLKLSIFQSMWPSN